MGDSAGDGVAKGTLADLSDLKKGIAFPVVLRYNRDIEGALRCSSVKGIDQADVDGLITTSQYY